MWVVCVIKEGKTQITGAISVNEADIETFKRLSENGIELEVRQVAKDNKINLMIS